MAFICTKPTLEYRFHLDYLRIQLRQNQASVDLLENNEITYEDNPDQPSKVANIEHHISLIKTKDRWVITNDEYTDDLKRLLDVLDKSQIYKNIENNHDQIYPDTTPPKLNPPAAKASATTNGKWLFGYNNSAARIYADIYYDGIGVVPAPIRNMAGWNPSWNPFYTEYEKDCTNFVSQAVFEGVRYTASDKNYFYPDPSNYNDWWYYKFSSPEDGSFRWVRTYEFYEFLTTNYSNYIYNPEDAIRGPVGHVIDLCYIKTGDLIFMKLSGAWEHAVIVDQVGSFTCSGNTVYVAAHDAPAYRRPLYEYSGYNWYPVKIDGFLDEAYTIYLPIALAGVSSIAKGTLGNPYPSPVEDFPQQLNTLINPYPNP